MRRDTSRTGVHRGRLIEPLAAPEKDTDREPDAEVDLKRIGEIIQNARATWFVLLGVLVFAGITLLGIEDTDFFAVDSNTRLPLVGVSVPVTYFFSAGATLVAALYIYFHLYLELLWAALGKAPARIGSHPLSERVTPWLVNEWALRRRDQLNRAMASARDGADTPVSSVDLRAMAWIGTVMSVGLVWIFGLVILGYFWWRSMPAHMDIMTGWIGLLFTFALWAGWRSWWNATRLLVGLPSSEVLSGTRKIYLKRIRTFAIFSGLTVAIWAASMAATASKWWPQALARIGPVKADLVEAQLSQLPTDWRPRDQAEQLFRAAWAKNRGIAVARPFPKSGERELEIDFQISWSAERSTQTRAIRKPDLDGRNLRSAALRRAQLVGVSLYKADLRGADLRDANLDGADLYAADLTGANLSDANLEGADLRFAKLDKTDLSFARMVGANVDGITLNGAATNCLQIDHNLLLARTSEETGAPEFGYLKLDGRRLQLADFAGKDLICASFRGAYLINADFSGADLRFARLNGAQMAFAKFTDAKLSQVNMRFADLSDGNFCGADLSEANLSSTTIAATDFRDANLSKAYLNDIFLFSWGDFEGANFAGTGLRKIDLTTADISSARQLKLSFGDASVTLPATYERPCQWGSADEGPLDDAQYYGRWLGWLQSSADHIFIPDFLDPYEPVPPPPGCKWENENPAQQSFSSRCSGDALPAE